MSESEENRVIDFLLRMSLDDKIALLCGEKTSFQLGIPKLELADGPAGIRDHHGSTQLPAPIVLGATFDGDAAQKYASLIGQEALTRGIQIMLAPTVNIARVPFR